MLFSEMDASPLCTTSDLPSTEEKGLPIEAFAKVQEMFSNVDWLDPKISVLEQINIIQEKLESGSPQIAKKIGLLQELSPEEVTEIQKSDGLQKIGVLEKLEASPAASAEKDQVWTSVLLT